MAEKTTMINFFSLKNDDDMAILKILPPYEGFYRKVKSMQGNWKEKPHYRVWVIGDVNAKTKKADQAATISTNCR